MDSYEAVSCKGFHCPDRRAG